MVDRSLAIRARCRESHSNATGAARVFVRSVHRLLERLRRARRPRHSGDSRRRPRQPGSPRTDASRARSPPISARRPTPCASPKSRPNTKSTWHNSVEKIIVAGEPGGSVAARVSRIESAWGARVIDHGGATEVGPWGFADAAGRGLHINEAHFRRRVHLGRDGPASRKQASFLTWSSLHSAATGSPVIRYRTGDLVRPLGQRTDRTVSCFSKAAFSAAPTT